MSTTKYHPFCIGLTHWGRLNHICVTKLTTIGSDNSLSPGRRQAIIWTSAGILLIWHQGTNLNEMLIKFHTFSFKKMPLKMPSAKRRPSCLCLNVLKPFTCYFLQREHKHIFTFCVISPNWYDAGSWNPSSNKTRTYLFYIVNIMAADVLAT